MGETGTDPAELRRQVTSPGGTTAAALAVLMGEQGFTPLLDSAVQAAVARARELGG
jgi:pyrroline-5-carboxylate reductase